MILFCNRTKIEWERDNFIKRKKNTKAQLSINQMLKDELKKIQFYKVPKREARVSMSNSWTSH